MGRLQKIRTFGQSFSNTPNEKFLLMILCSQAKLENDNRGINVKRGIRSKCEMGWRPGAAPIGYINRSYAGVKEIALDEDRASIIREIFERSGLLGQSGRTIKDWLDSSGFKTKAGEQLSLSQIYRILINPFYYGYFKYPEGSGNVYKGAHKPLITKALFDQIQQAKITPSTKTPWGTKQFAFKDILKCGSCGASITAEEKFKARVDGGLNRHVYYRCTKKANPQCPERSINEQELNDQLISFIAENSEGIKITDELARKVVSHTEIVEDALSVRAVDYGTIDPLTEYSRYVLTIGSNAQRQKLIEGIKSTFMIRNRQVEVV